MYAIRSYYESIGMTGKLICSPDSCKTYLHPGRQADMIYKEDVIGVIGEVHPDVADLYDIGTKTYIAVIDIPVILKHASFDRKYVGVAKYPAVTRDISMVVPKEILAGQIEEVIEKRGGKLLEEFSLFDIYEGRITSYNVCYTKLLRHRHRRLADWGKSAVDRRASIDVRCGPACLRDPF